MDRARPPVSPGLLLAASPLFAAAIFYLLDLSRLTVAMPFIGWLALLGLAPAVMAWKRDARFSIDWAAWAATAAMAALLVFQLRGAFLLPAHDHLTPLAVGRAIAAHGTALHQTYSAGASLAAYPPGLGVLTAPLFFVFGDVATLGAYTWIAAASVALVPIAWAVALRRLFLPDTPLWPLTVAMAIGVFMMDRTLMSASIYAGKNAFFTAALLFPVAFVLLIEGVGEVRREVLAGLACLGAVMVHYSAAYMLACATAAWLLIERPRPEAWLRLALVGAVVLALFIPQALYADRSAMIIVTEGRLLSPGQFLLGLVTGKYNNVLFIYHQFDKLKIAPWPWKGGALVGSFVLVAVTTWVLRRNRDPLAGYLGPLARLSGTFLLAIGFAAVLGSGLIPKSGIDRLYTSWYVFFLAGPVFAALVLALWSVAKSSFRAPFLLAGSSLALLALTSLGGFVLVDDYLKARRYVLKNATERGELAALRDLLRAAEAHGPCYLAMQSGIVEGDSAIMPDITQVTHALRTLDYAPLLSTCVPLTGTFTVSAVKGGRDVKGYPSSEALAALPPGSRLLFIGSENELARYLASMPTLRAEKTGDSLGFRIVARLERSGL